MIENYRTDFVWKQFMKNEQIKTALKKVFEYIEYTIGGTIYTDPDNPLTSGLEGVTVTVSGSQGTFEATTSGAQGLWQMDVPEGTYTVTPSKSGYGFEHIVSGQSDGLDSITIVVNLANQTQNQSIQFLATSGGTGQYSLTASVVGANGSVSPTSGTYAAGTVVDLTATPDTGYHVKAWTGTDDDSSTANTNTVTMNSNKTVTVEFEAVPTVAFAMADSSGSEPTTAVNLAVSLSPASSRPTTVNYAVTSGTATGGGVDYTMASGQLSFAPGDTTINITISVQNDSIDEEDETIVVTLSGPTNGILGTKTSHTYTINDDDPAPTVEFAATTSSNDEGAIAQVNLTVNLSAASAKNVSVNYSASGTATGSDYTLAAGPLTLSPGDISKDITIHIINDGVEEPDETIIVTLSNPVNATLGTNKSHTYTIIDADDAGVDASTVMIQIEGDLIYDGANENPVGVYDSTGNNQAVKGICRRVGTEIDYMFVFQASTLFDCEQKVDVEVNATDKTGYDMTDTYSFFTQMRTFGKNIKVNTDTGTLVQNHPATAMDSSGNIWVVWEHTIFADDSDIYIGKLPEGGDAFESSQLVFDNPNDQRKPAISIDGNDKIYVIWQGDDPNGLWDIFGSTSTNGTNWSSPVKVNSDDPHNKSNQISPAIAIDGSNKAYIAWEDNSKGDLDKDIWVATSADSIVWTSKLVATAADNQTEPAVSIDLFDDTAYIFWTDARNSGTDIYGSKKSASWIENALVNSESNQSSPTAAISEGVLYLLWVDDDISSDDIFYGNDILGLPIDGISIVDELGTVQSSPSIAANETKVFACWQDSRNVSNNADTDIYYAEKSGTGFGTNILVNDDIGTYTQTTPVINTDIDGNPFMVWVDNRQGNNDIYYAGAMSVGPALVTGTVTAGSGDTVEVNSRLKIEIPAGALSADTSVTIAEMVNPPELPSEGFGVYYEFCPSGLEFNTPVTITLPHTDNDCIGYSVYQVYWYNAETDLWSQDGISNVEHLIDSQDPTLHIVRFNTPHFTAFGAGGGVPGAAGGGGGGGGGGGCSVSAGGEGNIVEFLLPYIGFIIMLVILTVLDARVRRAHNR
jgi:hypothetical protein